MVWYSHVFQNLPEFVVIHKTSYVLPKHLSGTDIGCTSSLQREKLERRGDGYKASPKHSKENSMGLWLASWSPRRADSVVSGSAYVQRQKSDSSKTGREREFSLLQYFVLPRPSVGCMRPTHIEEGNMLYSVY